MFRTSVVLRCLDFGQRGGRVNDLRNSGWGILMGPELTTMKSDRCYCLRLQCGVVCCRALHQLTRCLCSGIVQAYIHRIRWNGTLLRSKMHSCRLCFVIQGGIVGFRGFLSVISGFQDRHLRWSVKPQSAPDLRHKSWLHLILQCAFHTTPTFYVCS